jgi:hypothetical protein
MQRGLGKRVGLVRGPVAGQAADAGACGRPGPLAPTCAPYLQLSKARRVLRHSVGLQRAGHVDHWWRAAGTATHKRGTRVSEHAAWRLRLPVSCSAALAAEPLGAARLCPLLRELTCMRDLLSRSLKPFAATGHSLRWRENAQHTRPAQQLTARGRCPQNACSQLRSRALTFRGCRARQWPPARRASGSRQWGRAAARATAAGPPHWRTAPGGGRRRMGTDRSGRISRHNTGRGERRGTARSRNS